MKFDVIITGGGYNGLTLAGMLAGAGLQVCLIEKRNLQWEKLQNEPSRLFAIARSSVDIFKKHKLLTNIDTLGQSINHIRVVDNSSHSFTDFDPKSIRLPNFGYMVEEHVLGNALYSNVKKLNNLKIIEQLTSDAIEISQSHINVLVKNSTYTAKLLVAADGKYSMIRSTAGIDYAKHTYNQSAVICDLKHKFNHYGVAVEKFMPTGPFAILPKAGGFSSSIVWTMPDDQAQALVKLDNEDILELIQERFAGYLGNIKLESRLRAFKLELIYAQKYYGKRVALLGDALHAIHPLAGQGLNLSLRDADTLAGLIIKQSNLGLDIGSEHMLKEYQQLREPDNLMMIEGTDKLNWLFSNNLLPLKLLRRAGLRIVEKTTPLKKIFMKYASGV